MAQSRKFETRDCQASPNPTELLAKTFKSQPDDRKGFSLIRGIVSFKFWYRQPELPSRCSVALQTSITLHNVTVSTVQRTYEIPLPAYDTNEVQGALLARVSSRSLPIARRSFATTPITKGMAKETVG
jgi:hypothetical protein